MRRTCVFHFSRHDDLADALLTRMGHVVVAREIRVLEMQMVTLPHATSRQRIAQAFDRGASEYLTLARAQHVMASRLFETLPTTLPDAAVVLDLGCGPGQWTRELACHYPTARCLGLDLSMAMLREASRSPDTPPRHLTPCNVQPPIHWLRGDAERLPVADNSLDLVFSSLAVQ